MSRSKSCSARKPVRLARRFALLPFIAALALTGCGDRPLETAGNSEKSPATETKTDNVTKTTSVTPSTSGVESSPASTSVLPPKEAGPGIVCETFLRLLKAGDRLAAEELLTSTALAVTSKANLKLEPPGSASAEYEVGSIRYATTRQKVAQVDCVVKEQIDGRAVSTTVTWLVRLQNDGWRISGIVLTDDDNLQDLLSFENPDDVNRINNALMGDEAANIERQANAGAETSIK